MPRPKLGTESRTVTRLQPLIRLSPEIRESRTLIPPREQFFSHSVLENLHPEYSQIGGNSVLTTRDRLRREMMESRLPSFHLRLDNPRHIQRSPFSGQPHFVDIQPLQPPQDSLRQRRSRVIQRGATSLQPPKPRFSISAPEEQFSQPARSRFSVSNESISVEPQRRQLEQSNLESRDIVSAPNLEVIESQTTYIAPTLPKLRLDSQKSTVIEPQLLQRQPLEMGEIIIGANKPQIPLPKKPKMVSGGMQIDLKPKLTIEVNPSETVEKSPLKLRISKPINSINMDDKRVKKLEKENKTLRKQITSQNQERAEHENQILTLQNQLESQDQSLTLARQKNRQRKLQINRMSEHIENLSQLNDEQQEEISRLKFKPILKNSNYVEVNRPQTPLPKKPKMVSDGIQSDLKPQLSIENSQEEIIIKSPLKLRIGKPTSLINVDDSKFTKLEKENKTLKKQSKKLESENKTLKKQNKEQLDTILDTNQKLIESSQRNIENIDEISKQNRAIEQYKKENEKLKSEQNNVKNFSLLSSSDSDSDIEFPILKLKSAQKQKSSFGSKLEYPATSEKYSLRKNVSKLKEPPISNTSHKNKGSRNETSGSQQLIPTVLDYDKEVFNTDVIGLGHKIVPRGSPRVYFRPLTRLIKPGPIGDIKEKLYAGQQIFWRPPTNEREYAPIQPEEVLGEINWDVDDFGRTSDGTPLLFTTKNLPINHPKYIAAVQKALQNKKRK